MHALPTKFPSYADRSNGLELKFLNHTRKKDKHFVRKFNISNLFPNFISIPLVISFYVVQSKFIFISKIIIILLYLWL
jgi:hypothetical protein